MARVILSPNTLTLRPWETAPLTAVTLDAEGDTLTDRTITWSSSDSTRLSISSQGVVTGNLLGTVVVTATSEGQSSTMNVTVSPGGSVLIGSEVNIVPTATGSETSIAINPTNPLNLVVSANFWHFASFDGGRTWSNAYWQGIAPAAEADPTVAFDHEGNLYRQGLSLFTAPRHLYVDKSTDGGRTLARRSAYRPAAAEGNPDQGILAVDVSAGSPHRGSLYAIFSDYPTPQSPSCVGFCLRVIASRDGGATWGAPVDISDETAPMQEHSSYLSTGPNGEVYAAWWNSANRIMFARSLDGGQSWQRNVIARQAVSRDTPHTWSDDVRGNVTIDVDRGTGPYRGRIYVSAVDRNNDGGAVDAWMISSADGGASWSSAIPLSDGPRGAGKFYFQPRISVAPNGRVDASWYDTRNWTGSDINAVTYDVYHAFSTDGGLSFSPSMRLTSTSAVKRTACPTQRPCGQRQLYEYMGLASDDTRAITAWTDLRTGSARVFVSVVWHSP